ncbi:MAG TPA: DUF2079 domain-containing protein, partial [Candidatus Baltobacteraceae bacterium]|nr:DUF2079 domain-containing protein [Candidatus Baltobacteraceae bacterium]
VSRGAALALSCAYLISPSVQGFAYNEFSEDHFAPLLIFALALCVKKRSFAGTLIVAQLLCGIKEDLALFLVWFGIAGAFWYDRRLGFSVAALAALNAITYHAVLAALGHHASIPPYQFRVIHPPQDIAFLLEILAPFAFAPLLLRWRLLLALPLLAELFCATNDGFPLARAGVHYTEPLVACAALAAALVLRRDERFARWALALSFVMALLFNTTILHAGRHLYAANGAYFRARLLAGTDRRAIFSAEQQGEWAVAASDLNARVAPIGTVLRAQKAARDLREKHQPPASFATRP